MEVGVFHPPGSRTPVLDGRELLYRDLCFSSGGAPRFCSEQAPANAPPMDNCDDRLRLFPETSRCKSSVHSICSFWIRDAHHAA